MKVRRMTATTKQYGAVSLFIVIFTTLLVSIITVGFIRIMLSDQRQATAADLSASAYDSAQAGVEDAKRALLDYQSICASGNAGDCAAAQALINSPVCNKALSNVITYVAGQEVMVQQTAGDKALQQAYTCVKIDRQTNDYLGELTKDESKLIHLAGVSSFDSVRLEWFSSKNLQGASTTVNLPSDTNMSLLSEYKWTTAPNQNRPSLMRTQLMQFGTGFTLSDFEDVVAPAQSNANTLFLYPTTSSDMTPRAFTNNVRKVASSSPTSVHCDSTIESGKYSCSVDLKLPTPIGGGVDRTAYLRLTSLYKKANYRVTLLNSLSPGVPVKFDGVQPQIDSTGRANDLFRRVQSRVEVIDTDFPYPDAAVDTTGNLCKDFVVTDTVDGYSTNGCTP